MSIDFGAPLGLSWSTTWMNRKVIDRFRVSHVPAHVKEGKNDYGAFFCINPKITSWVSLDELLSDGGNTFIETLKLSDVKVTKAAATELARVVGKDAQTVLKELAVGGRGRR